MDDTIIARFTKDGCGYDPVNDSKLPRGTNVMHHPVFWDVERKWAKQTAKDTGSKLVVCQ